MVTCFVKLCLTFVTDIYNVCVCVCLQPRWEPYIPEFGAYVEVAFTSSAHLWPWSGYLAISVTASKAAASWDGIAKGQITLTIESPPDGVSVLVRFFHISGMEEI